MTPLDAEHAAAFGAKALEVIDVAPGLGAFFKLDYLVRNALCAAIFEGDFRDADGAVSQVCAANGIDALACAALGQVGLPAFRVAAAHDDLRVVREQYHIPSYVISDDFERVAIVSDSDYYWGVFGDADLVGAIVRRARNLLLTREDIAPYLDSTDAHDQRVGAMLRRFHEICDRSMQSAGSQPRPSPGF